MATMDMSPRVHRDHPRRGLQELAATDLELLTIASSPRAKGLTSETTSVALRFRVRFCRWRLDRELAAGEPPHRSESHGLRARQLAGARVRRQVAASLRRLVDDAELPYVALNAVPIRRGDVLAWRQGLPGLADRLDAATPVNPSGVARARLLLTDGMGPLYNPDPQRLLGETIWWIADGLDAGTHSK